MCSSDLTYGLLDRARGYQNVNINLHIVEKFNYLVLTYGLLDRARGYQNVNINLHIVEKFNYLARLVLTYGLLDRARGYKTEILMSFLLKIL